MKIKKKEVLSIPINMIDQDFNSRGRGREEDVSDLMYSIQESGLMNPVGVVKKGERYELIDGNRRFMAHKKLGKHSIEAIVRPAKTDKEKIILNLTENVIRKDLNMFEMAKVLGGLIKDHSMNVKELSVLFSMSQSKIRNILLTAKDTPVEFRGKISNDQGKARKNGTIPLTFAQRIAGAKKEGSINLAESKELLEISQKRILNQDQLKGVLGKIRAGHSVKEAVAMNQHMVRVTGTVFIDQQHLDLLKKRYPGMALKKALNKIMEDGLRKI